MGRLFGAQIADDSGSTTGVATTILALLSAGALAGISLVGANQLTPLPLDRSRSGAPAVGVEIPGTVVVTPKSRPGEQTPPSRATHHVRDRSGTDRPGSVGAVPALLPSPAASPDRPAPPVSEPPPPPVTPSTPTPQPTLPPVKGHPAPYVPVDPPGGPGARPDDDEGHEPGRHHEWGKDEHCHHAHGRHAHREHAEHSRHHEDAEHSRHRRHHEHNEYGVHRERGQHGGPGRHQGDSRRCHSRGSHHDHGAHGRHHHSH